MRQKSNFKFYNEKLANILRSLPFKKSNNKYIDRYLKKTEDKKAILELHEQWIRIMVNSGALNDFYETYGLNFTEKTIYGFKSECFLTSGLKYNKLLELKEELQDGLGCLITLNRYKRSRMVRVEFIMNLQEHLKYKVVAPLRKKDNNPRNIYLGNDYSGLPIFVDMLTLPHILLTGGTRSGKLFCY